MNECEFLDKVNKLIARLSDRALLRMLSSTQEVLDHLTKTNIIRESNKMSAEGNIKFGLLMKTVEDINIDPIKSNMIIWLTGFRFAAESKDPDHMLMQLSIFVAAQRSDIFRISDDKLRLCMTQMHCEALEQLVNAN